MEEGDAIGRSGAIHHHAVVAASKACAADPRECNCRTAIESCAAHVDAVVAATAAAIETPADSDECHRLPYHGAGEVNAILRTGHAQRTATHAHLVPIQGSYDVEAIVPAKAGAA